MGAGGWKSPSSMLVYTKTNEANARRGYDEAMRRLNEQASIAMSNRILSHEEFLAQYVGKD
jgi:hypothetical protein